MPRLAVVDFEAHPAGSQNFWAYALTDPVFAPVERHVLTPAGKAPRFTAAEARAAGIAIHSFGGRGARLLRRAAVRVGLDRDPLATTVSAVDPDLVWFNLAGTGEIGWIDAAAAWCRSQRVPYWLIMQHVHDAHFFPSDAHATAARVVAQGAARILTVSDRNRASLAAAFGERLPNIETAVNGVQQRILDAAAGVAAGQPPRVDGTARFISPARLDPAYKGQHLLLEAFGAAAWRARDWHLTFAGGGTHADLVRRLVAFHGVPAQRVTFTGHASDMVGALAAADVIVMPSLSEGFPFALAEGMACGRPAMGTPVGGIDELVREGETGWLARATTAADVGAALERCWADRARWPEFGRAAHDRAVRTCSLGAAHQRLLEHLLSDARRR